VKRLSVILALILVLAASAALAQGTFKADYKGMAFGSELTEFKNMKSLRKQGELEFFTRYGDDRNFQGVPLDTQTYGFYQGKFCLALFSAKGPANFTALKAYFDSAFGKPSQPKQGLKQFSYTSGDLTVEMGYDDTRKVTEVSYIYRPIMHLMMPGK